VEGEGRERVRDVGKEEGTNEGEGVKRGKGRGRKGVGMLGECVGEWEMGRGRG